MFSYILLCAYPVFVTLPPVVFTPYVKCTATVQSSCMHANLANLACGEKHVCHGAGA